MIQPIVEGHGEVEAVPVLLRRLRDEAGAFHIQVGGPIRRSRSQLVREESVCQTIEVARRQPRCDAIISNIRYPKTKRPPATTPRPDCLGCGKPLRRYKRDGQAFDDGTPQEWGDYGDNRFCGLTCGWRWACRHAPMPKMQKGKGM